MLAGIEAEEEVNSFISEPAKLKQIEMADEITETMDKVAITPNESASKSAAKNGESAAKRTPVRAGVGMEAPARRTPGGRSASMSSVMSNSASRRNISTGSQDSPRGPDFDACIRNYKSKSAAEIYKESPRPGSSKKYAHINAKIGSLEKANHKPNGGNVVIPNHKLNFDNVSPKVGSLDNVSHKPGGGNVKIASTKLDLSNVTPKVGSKANINHTPGGGNVKIAQKRLSFRETASSKVDARLVKPEPKPSEPEESAELAPAE